MRIFLAVEIPENIKERLAEIQEELKPQIPGVHWEKTEKLHLTLVFLGEVPDERAGELEEAVSKVLQFTASSLRAAQDKVGVKGLKMGFSEVGVFPKSGRPRVVLAEAGEGREQVVELQRRLAEALSGAGFEFTRLSQPHVTLGRFKRQRPPTLRVRKPQPQPKTGLLTLRVGKSFEVKEVVIVESKLHPAGAIHTPMARIPLC